MSVDGIDRVYILGRERREVSQDFPAVLVWVTVTLEVTCRSFACFCRCCRRDLHERPREPPERRVRRAAQRQSGKGVKGRTTRRGDETGSIKSTARAEICALTTRRGRSTFAVTALLHAYLNTHAPRAWQKAPDELTFAGLFDQYTGGTELPGRKSGAAIARFGDESARRPAAVSHCEQSPSRRRLADSSHSLTCSLPLVDERGFCFIARSVKQSCWSPLAARTCSYSSRTYLIRSSDLSAYKITDVQRCRTQSLQPCTDIVSHTRRHRRRLRTSGRPCMPAASA